MSAQLSRTAQRGALREIIEPRRILVSAQMGIGNLIMFVPFLRSLRQGYPHAHIAAVFSEPNGAEEVLSALAPGLVDEIVQLRSEGCGRVGRLWRGVRLGLRGWDMVVVRFNGFRGEILSAALVGRSRYRVGHASSPDWQSRWDSFLNIPVVMQPDTHEVERYLQIAESLGLRIVERDPSLTVPDEAFRLATEKLPQLASVATPWVVLAPGSSAGQVWKRWPEDRWGRLAAALAGMGLGVVFVGSRGEAPMIDAIISAAGPGSTALNTAGRLTLAESAAVVSRALAVVCCDSAIMHVAAALGVPVVGIFGPTDERRTGPKGRGHVILRSPGCKGGCYSLGDPKGHSDCDTAACMRGVAVETVIAALGERLERDGRAAPP